MLQRQYIRHLKASKTPDVSEMHNVLSNFNKVRLALDQEDQSNQSPSVQKCLLSAPGFLSLLMQANRQYLMQLNASEEIAKYIHLEMLSTSNE